MQGVPRVHEVRAARRTLEGEVAALRDRDRRTRRGDLAAQCAQHHGRRVDGEHVRPSLSGEERELPRSRSQIDYGALAFRGNRAQPLDLGSGAGVFLLVVMGDVLCVGVLPAETCARPRTRSAVWWSRRVTSQVVSLRRGRRLSRKPRRGWWPVSAWCSWAPAGCRAASANPTRRLSAL